MSPKYKETKFNMKEIMRYQAKTDLKILRQLCNLSKEDVSAYIGYSIRTLERIEEENAVVDEAVAKCLSCLYNINFSEQFYKTDKRHDDWLNEKFADFGNKPNNMLVDDSIYYCLYVRRMGMFSDCIAGKGLWIREYNRNKEVRRLRRVDAKRVLERCPDIPIINNGKEWDYWYFKLCIGKLYKVLVSEACMKECMRDCLEERVVRKDELMKYDGITDVMFWGGKGGKR